MIPVCLVGVDRMSILKCLAAAGTHDSCVSSLTSLQKLELRRILALSGAPAAHATNDICELEFRGGLSPPKFQFFEQRPSLAGTLSPLNSSFYSLIGSH